MSKALRIIAIVMPFVIFVLFFVPLSTSVVDAYDIDGNHSYAKTQSSCFEYSKSCAELINDFQINSDDYLAADVTSAISTFRTRLAMLVVFFCVAILISTITAFLAQKRPVFTSLNCLAFAFFWIWLVSGTKDTLFNHDGIRIITPHAAFYISLILSAFFLAVFVAYAVKWLKARLDLRPPREHKPTKEERIAELEARVRELESRD